MGVVRKTFGEVSVELMRHQSLFSRDPGTTRYNLIVLSRHFGDDSPIDVINTAEVERFIAARKTAERKNGTINRQLATLSKSLTLAIRNGWHAGPNPVRALGILREAQPRTPYYTQAEMQRFIDAAAPHLRPIIYGALVTMARRRELLTLQWPHVHLDQRFISFQQENTKARKERPVPICEGLYAVLLSLGPKPAGLVFTYRGKPIKSVKTALREARKRAGLPEITFRDLRHVGSCWFMENGGRIEELQAILGHSEIALTQRYGRFSKGYIGTLAARLGPPTFPDRHS